MTRTPCTLMYSAVLLSLLLAVVVGSPTQPVRNIPDPSKGMQPVGATEADLLSHEEPDGVTVVKENHLRSGKKVSRRSYAPLFKPQVDKFLAQVRVARHLTGYFAKHMPCQDKTSACGATMPAEEAANYSPQQHPSEFLLCLATVVCRDECTLKCTVPVENSVPEKPLATAVKENERLVKFEKNVSTQVGALDVKLAKLIEEFDSQRYKLDEFGQHINHLNDEFQKKLTAATASTLQSVDNKTGEVKALFNEKTESMIMTMSSVLSMVVINPKTNRWTLTGYAGHKAEAIKKGWFFEIGEKVYLRRYLIYWGIYYVANNGLVSLHLSFQLYKGRYDEFLEWPFSNELKLCIIHPETQNEHCTSDKPLLSEGNNKYFARPQNVSNGRAYFSGTKINSSYIENNGYIKEDKLRVRLEVLS